ncbi:dihydrofolate reductase [Azoarcus indigens]|nr:dihydrofolate reductase [Azoarcus indigens]
MRITYYVAASVDGYIATANGGTGWLAPFEASGDDYGYADFYAGIDALLLGRRTYEHCRGLGAWPYADKPCRVFSRDRSRPLHEEEAGAGGGTVRITTDDPATVIGELAAAGARNLWLVGGGQLAGEFLVRGLLTDLILSVVPVTLGSGIALFGGDTAPAALQLRSSRLHSMGLVQLHYRIGNGQD